MAVEFAPWAELEPWIEIAIARLTVRSDPNDSVARSPAGSTWLDPRVHLFSGKDGSPCQSHGNDAGEWVNMTGARCSSVGAPDLEVSFDVFLAINALGRRRKATSALDSPVAMLAPRSSEIEPKGCSSIRAVRA
jgi:hypothetical protein